MLIKANPLYDDEPGNFMQVKFFLNGNYSMYAGYGKLPGYPLVLWLLSLLLNTKLLAYFRLINFCFTISSLIIFYLLAKRIDYRYRIIKTIQFAFFPVFFPYRFLLYSENLSTPLVLLSLYATYIRRYQLAAIAGLWSIFIRQSNIIWYLFTFLFIFIQNNNPKYSLIKYKRYISKQSFFLLGFIFIILFVVLNRGLVLGNQRNYQSNFSFNIGNLYWALLSFFFIFLPLNITNYSKIINYIKNKKVIFYIVMNLVLIALLIFSNNHPWNQYQEHLRNKVLLFFNSNIILKSISFILAGYSIFSLLVTKLHIKVPILFYTASFFSLIPIWLIESRYYFIPVFLFILFRKADSKLVEYLMTFIFIIFSLIFFEGYFHQKYYL